MKLPIQNKKCKICGKHSQDNYYKKVKEEKLKLQNQINVRRLK